MRLTDATVLLPAPDWRDPRVHLIDDVWLLTIFSVLLATAIPWITSGFQVDVVAAAAGLLALASLHISFTVLLNPARAAGAGRSRALVGLHAAGVIVLGFIWQHVGGLQNPAFLLAFALPIVGAIFLSRWQPYVMALLAIAVIGVVALLQAPELRWYAGLAGGRWIATIVGQDSIALRPPFAGFYAPSSYFIVMVEVFAVLLLACAFAAEYLGSLFDRLQTHVLVARGDAERSHALWSALIEHLPVAAILVDASTLQILRASHRVPTEYWTSNLPPAGRRLFDAIRFSYPEIVQELIAGAGGVARPTILHAGEQLKVTEVRIEHLAQRGRRLALVIIEDRTENFCLNAALDVADYAALIVNSRSEVLAFNRAASGLFTGTRIGADASQLLGQSGAVRNWWEPSLTGRLKMHVEILDRLYQVTSTAIVLPGEEERIFVIACRPMAKGSVPDKDRTVLTATLSQSL